MPVSIAGNNLFWQSRIDNSKLKTDSKQTQSIMGGLGKSVASLGIFASVGIMATSAIKSIINVNKEFEKSVSVLSSITGAVGEDLDFYKEQAIIMGSSTTQSATQVVEAFKLIGSQRPELLQDKEALAKITKEAITLSEAAQIDVPTAAKAMTTALNQMGDAAGTSTEIIDVLANSSQLGAGDIPFLSKAIEAVGKDAADANLDFAQLSSVIETLAPSFSEPSQAALQFRDVLARLQKAGKGMSTGTFNLKEALNQVNGEFNAIQDPVDKTKAKYNLFGSISMKTGKILLENADNIDVFAEKLKKSGTAAEQAFTNTDNLEGAILGFQSAIEGLQLSLNEDNGLTGSLKELVKIGTMVVQNGSLLTDIYKDLFGEIGGLFKVVYDLADSLGLVTDKGDAVATIMGILATTTKVAMLPMRGLIWALTKAIKLFTWVTNVITDFVKTSDSVQWFLDLIKDRFDLIFNAIDAVTNALKDFFGVAKDEGPLISSELSAAFAKMGFAMGFATKKTKELKKELEKDPKDPKKDFNNTVDLERLKIDAMKDGIEKRVALINYEYDKRKEEFEKYGIDSANSEQERYDKIIQTRIDFNNELYNVNSEQEAINAEKQFTEMQAYELSLFNLLETSEEQKRNFEIMQEIERLARKKKLNKDLTQLEKDTIDAQILAQEKLLKSTEDSGGIMIKVFEAVGSAIQTTSSNSEASLGSYANAVIDAAEKAIAAVISEAVIKMTADGMNKGGFPLGLILGPAAGAAAYAAMKAIIPKFEQGGVVPGGSFSGDNVPILANSGELILNNKQSANLLYKIAQSPNGISNKKMDNLIYLMQNQNDILDKAKTAIVINNELHIINKHGKPTGSKITF